jgi:cytochrome c5
MRIFAAAALLSAVILTPVLAAAQATSTATAPAAPAMSGSSSVNLDEVVCKNSPPPTGSRLGGGRECHTQREWDQRQKEAQDALIKNQQVGFNSGAH